MTGVSAAMRATATNNGKHVAHTVVKANAHANALRNKLSALHGAVGYRVMVGATACLPWTLCVICTPPLTILKGVYTMGPNDTFLYGKLNDKVVCPQCQEKGYVHTKEVKQKAGISGGKVTGALLTGGLSILATGLSRKVNVTEAHCTSCNSTWHF